MKDWEALWQVGNTGWDMGSVSPPLKEFMDQESNKNLRILIPGCGNAYEAEYLVNAGFRNVHIVELSPSAVDSFLSRFPNFPKEQIHIQDFFTHKGQYDLVIEQTFFCAIEPSQREAYVNQMSGLIIPGGRIMGVLFNFPLDDGPPYGGDVNEYRDRFGNEFDIDILEPCRNSIPPRQGRELFFLATKK